MDFTAWLSDTKERLDTLGEALSDPEAIKANEQQLEVS